MKNDLMEDQSITVAGVEFVLVPRNRYERLTSAEDQPDESDLPPLPKATATGNYPAVATARALIARKIILGRRAAGLTQAQLAKRAGVRLETISRLENARHSAGTATIEKIDHALLKLPPDIRRKIAVAQRDVKAGRVVDGETAMDEIMVELSNHL